MRKALLIRLKKRSAYGKSMYARLTIVFLLLFSCVCFADVDYTVGISPPYQDIGLLQKWDSKLVNFRILTPSTEPLLVYLEKLDADIGNFQAAPDDFSEQPCSEWANLIKNPITIEPSGEQRSYSYADILLQIPADAEPGLHKILVRPSVFVPDQNTGMVGSAVVGVTTFSLSFTVEGDAVRSAYILDSVKTGQDLKNVETSTYLKNNGTVTIMAKVMQKIGNQTVSSSVQRLSPQEIKVFKVYLPLEAFREHSSLHTVADYTTGMAVLDSEMTLEGVVFQEASSPEQFPLWLLALIVLAIILACIYLKK